MVFLLKLRYDEIDQLEVTMIETAIPQNKRHANIQDLDCWPWVKILGLSSVTLTALAYFGPELFINPATLLAVFLVVISQSIPHTDMHSLQHDVDRSSLKLNDIPFDPNAILDPRPHSDDLYNGFFELDSYLREHRIFDQDLEDDNNSLLIKNLIDAGLDDYESHLSLTGIIYKPVKIGNVVADYFYLKHWILHPHGRPIHPATQQPLSLEDLERHANTPDNCRLQRELIDCLHPNPITIEPHTAPHTH